MPFPLELKFMPEYEKNLGYSNVKTDIDIIIQALGIP